MVTIEARGDWLSTRVLDDPVLLNGGGDKEQLLEHKLNDKRPDGLDNILLRCAPKTKDYQIDMNVLQLGE